MLLLLHQEVCEASVTQRSRRTAFFDSDQQMAEGGGKFPCACRRRTKDAAGFHPGCDLKATPLATARNRVNGA
jgi:hypothetical protein